MAKAVKLMRRICVGMALFIAICLFVFLARTGDPGDPGKRRLAVDDRRFPSQPSDGIPAMITRSLTLEGLMLQGQTLHISLRTREIDTVRDLPTGLMAPSNPHVSSDKDFIESVSRGGSQGRLSSQGMCAALFARYSTQENEMGIYGLEAETMLEADERECLLRDIWAQNESVDRTRVYREGRILMVIWHAGVSKECWEAANERIVERMRLNGNQTIGDRR